MLAVKRRAMERAQVSLTLIDCEPRPERPATRAGCLEGGENAHRPCPFVSCKYHLFLEVDPRKGNEPGAISLNFPAQLGVPARAVWELEETCALDVADHNGATLEEVGALLNISHERVRQIEVEGVARLKQLSEIAALVDFCDEEPETWHPHAEVRSVGASL